MVQDFTRTSICIDEMVDKGKCPSLYFCTVATTEYDQDERERICFRCWKNYCIENNIKITYKEFY